MEVTKNEFNELADLYKVFGDSTRLAILNYLINKKVPVNDISEYLNMSQSAISHQLRYLRQTNFVKCEKKGREVYYELSDNHIETIIKMGLEHIKE